jgi:hypothetical protein
MSGVIVVCLCLFTDCSRLLHGSMSEQSLQAARLADQTYFEDSAAVFFAVYANPYSDKDLLWFTVLHGDTVDLHVYDALNDSLEKVCHFEQQEIPLYTLAVRFEPDRFVKCVLSVDGRRKCARIYPAWYSLSYPQWKTNYTVEEK